MPRLLPILLTATALAAPTALAQALPDAAALDAYMNAQTDANGFMGTVLVARGDDVVFAGGYGMADLELGVPNAREGVFRIGSVTKQFTAAAILRLQERGVLSVHDPLSRWLPDYPGGERVTLHQLLSHSAGVFNYTDLPEFERINRTPHTTDELIALVRDLPLEFEPGSAFAYSNSGYVLLTKVIEAATGEPYAVWMQREFFAPLGMTATAYDDAAEVVPQRVAGYARAGAGLRNADPVDLSFASGAGALRSTVDDLLTWARALQEGAVLEPASYAAMTAPAIAVDPESAYGYGLFLGSDRGRTVVEHGGGIDGFAAVLASYPDDDMTVVVLANVEQAPSPVIAHDLAAMALGDEVALPQPRVAVALGAELLASYPGDYQIMPDLIATVALDGDALSVTVPGQGTFAMLAEAPDAFFLQEVDVRFTFEREAGAVVRMVVHQGGQSVPAARVN